MKSDIASLTTDQAQRALLLVYDLLPAESWARGQKPRVANLRAFVERLEENAPTEIQPFLRALHAQDNPELKGGVAKEVLERLSANELVRPYVAQAVLQSREPHMSIPPEIVYLLLGFAALSVDVQTQWFETHSRVPELVKQLTNFVKTLPSGVVKAWLSSKTAPDS
jgi:hypothetical protein